MPINYKTVQGYAQATYEISRSRFLTAVQRVESEEAIAAFLQKIKKQHWEARHNCFAYILGARGALQKADDDGEPSGTAGKPILEILKKNDLKDTIIVVTRYFGGIKLGAGGLIRAYGKAASLGLAAAQLVEKTRFLRLYIEVDYALLSPLENNLRLKEYRVESKEFSDKVRLTLLAATESKEEVKANLLNWTAANCVIEEGDELYLEIPIAAAT